MHDFNQISKQTEIVVNDIQKRFPDCPYTIRILLWDDGTSLVECRYGVDGKIHISGYYDDVLNYREDVYTGKVMVIDEFGNETIKKLI